MKKYYEWHKIENTGEQTKYYSISIPYIDSGPQAKGKIVELEFDLIGDNKFMFHVSILSDVVEKGVTISEASKDIVDKINQYIYNNDMVKKKTFAFIFRH